MGRLASTAVEKLRLGVVVIPGEFVGYLRAGLHLQLEMTADEIAALSREPGYVRSAAYGQALCMQAATHALLELVGLDAERPERDVPVNLYRHRKPLVSALRLVSDVEARLLATGRCWMDADAVYGLGFFTWGVEQRAALPSTATAGTLALRVVAELEVAARLLRLGNGARLWRDLRTGRQRGLGFESAVLSPCP